MTLYERYITGNYGERILLEFFNVCGFDVEKILDSGKGDLKISSDKVSLNIEVKTAHKGKDDKWRFTLEKNGHKGITELVDYVILVAILDHRNVYFVIPAIDVRGRRHIAITSNPKSYAGYFAQYRYSWLELLERLNHD